uniref:G-protein coupled receptors family 1 profile domain-containing protein n=1 Tax=Cavia porcellus TaxID=10141 RepID=A0A286XUQ1_CAVPO
VQPHTPTQTQVTEFVMLGFAGKLAIFLVVCVDYWLWRPMYFFLTHLSCLEIWYTSVTVPKMLAGFIGADGGKSISYTGCMSQLFLFTFLGATGCFLLAAMAYGRYVAICVPLHYGSLVSWGTCFHMAAACFLTPIFPVYLMSQLTFCGPNIIDHFFCDETVDFLVSLAVLLISLTVIAVSYGNIVWILLHIQPTAFSTCAAHLTIVGLFYGTLFFMYVCIKMASSINFNKVVSVFYSVVMPMLNPLIYSLQNKEVKEGLGLTFSLRFWRG